MNVTDAGRQSTGWSVGKVAGIRCRGGVTVDMQWNCNAGTLAATMTSARDQSLRLEASGPFECATTEPASACRRVPDATILA